MSNKIAVAGSVAKSIQSKRSQTNSKQIERWCIRLCVSLYFDVSVCLWARARNKMKFHKNQFRQGHSHLFIWFFLLLHFHVVYAPTPQRRKRRKQLCTCAQIQIWVDLFNEWNDLYMYASNTESIENMIFDRKRAYIQLSTRVSFTRVCDCGVSVWILYIQLHRCDCSTFAVYTHSYILFAFAVWSSFGHFPFEYQSLNRMLCYSLLKINVRRSCHNNI